MTEGRMKKRKEKCKEMNKAGKETKSMGKESKKNYKNIRIKNTDTYYTKSRILTN